MLGFMELNLGAVLVGGLVILVFFLWWRFFHVARPAVPPLQIANDDPLMSEAKDKARATIARLRELAAQPNLGVRVKVPFVTSAGETECLWADLLSFQGSEMEVRYLTPPVTHTGRLERLHRHPISDLVDWIVELESGKYLGGYTMRVMFVRAREQWKTLPPELLAEEKKYLEADA